MKIHYIAHIILKVTFYFQLYHLLKLFLWLVMYVLLLILKKYFALIIHAMTLA